MCIKLHGHWVNGRLDTKGENRSINWNPDCLQNTCAHLKLNISLTGQSFINAAATSTVCIDSLIMGWQLIRCVFHCPALNAAPMFTSIIVNDNRCFTSNPNQQHNNNKDSLPNSHETDELYSKERESEMNPTNVFTEQILFFYVFAFVCIIRRSPLQNIFFSRRYAEYLPYLTVILISRDILLKWKLPPSS